MSKKVLFQPRYSLSIGLLLFIFLFGCNNDDSPVTVGDELEQSETDDDSNSTTDDESDEMSEVALSLVALVDDTDELSLLSEALEKADLTEALNAEGPFTVFAPTNKAIEELFDLLGDQYNSFDDFSSIIEIELLRRILLFHVVHDNIVSSDLKAGTLRSLYDNNTFEIKTSVDGFVISDASDVDSSFISVDNLATNGTAHIIDKILVPADVAEALNLSGEEQSGGKTIKELVKETEGFTFLKEALTITGLLDTLGKEGPFTVFAPSDGALTGLLTVLGSEFVSLADFDTQVELDLLRDILLYHVSPGILVSEDFAVGPMVTLSGENTIAIAEKDSELVLVDATSLQSKFITKDIPAKNGVIHVVDRILIPESLVDTVASSVSLAFETVMQNTGQLDTVLELFRLVQDRMNLEALAEKEFTFFFPSDKAFIDLYLEYGVDTIEKINSEEGLEILKKILSYHCVNNMTLSASDFVDAQILDTFQGEELKVLVNNGVHILDKTSEPSKVVYENQDILNGVIHVVDKVLLPEEILAELKSL